MGNIILTTPDEGGSTQFTEYKDLNDYLTGKKQVIEKHKKRGFKL